MEQVKTMFNKIFLFTVFVVLFIIPVQAVYATNLYLSPSNGNISTNKNFSVQVRLKVGGDKVNAVSAFLSYPLDKLEVAWIKYGSSAFSIEAESSFVNGIIKISRGNFSGVGGDVNIATVGFVGKVPGQAAVSFIDGSSAPRASDSSDSLDLKNSTGGVYNITTVAKSKRPAILGEWIDKNSVNFDNTKTAWFLSFGIIILAFLITKKIKHKK